MQIRSTMDINPQFAQLIASYHSPALQSLVATLAQSEPSVSVRANASKGLSRPQGAEGVAWESRGWYLDQRPVFTLDPCLHQGRYYVQEASSMVVGEAIRRIVNGSSAPLKFLDACAAPGGKTTSAIDSLPQGSLVVANEFDSRRASVLAENLAKWGSPNTIVSQGDSARIGHLGPCFDIALVDAPCSGEGMMRKDTEAAEQWSPALVALCAARQREILGNIWPAVKPGGYLIYSTCTFNRDENEEIVTWLIDTFGAESVDLGLAAHWGINGGIDTPYHCVRMLPNHLRGEGLFMAVVRKPFTPAPTPRPPKIKPQKAPTFPKEWLQGNFRAVEFNNAIAALPEQWADDMLRISATLHTKAMGVEVGTVKGRDLIPSQALAMSTALAPGAFPTAELTLESALTYLRREAVTLPEGAPKGHVLTTFGGYPLGFVKNLGNRSNNLYPQAWRIRSL